jgi:hypothetical protein
MESPVEIGTALVVVGISISFAPVAIVAIKTKWPQWPENKENSEMSLRGVSIDVCNARHSSMDAQFARVNEAITRIDGNVKIILESLTRLS